MKTIYLFAVFTLFHISILQLHAGELSLIENGKPNAQIVISANPPRTTLLAAKELQGYLQKITGAELGIVHKPDSSFPVSIFVGQSPHTINLGITTEGLEYGAYRITTGENWLVLIGDDTNFTPIEPWPRNNNDIQSGKMQREWNRITGKNWGYMHSQLHKHYSGSNHQFGTPNEQIMDEEGNVNVWTYDERGSFNAVCDLLRSLGVRWYMPGPLGEIVPERKSIVLSKIDKTVHPDFPLRKLNFRTSVYGRDVMMWGFRLGVRQPYGRQAAHGLHGMTDNEYTLKNHPDWFALYGGKRHNQLNIKNNQLCYSNEELFQEAIQFARAQLDHFNMDVVSIMPPDGYTAICQCDKCKGRESPELGERGRLSNYVWDFVNRVAKEVGKTHPDKKISNCAYGIYTEPPSNIEKLEPNLQVIIVGGRRPANPDRADLRRLRSEWQKKTDNPVEIFENYPFTGRGFYLPAYFPHLLGESINETKGQSRGEDIWLTMDFSDKAIGYNHFLIYFTARMYWGGKDQDIKALFQEYVKKFYGPAAPQMTVFFDYCENHWHEMGMDGNVAGRALELFESAKRTVSIDSTYGQRIQLIDNYLEGLRNKSVQLAQKRGPVPKLRLVSGSEQRGEIVIDGKLDDEPWVKIPVASTGRLSELQTGRTPAFGTHFMVEWIRNNLYFGIHCQELPGKKLNISTRDNGDQSIWYGDAVEIEIATDSHSYYQFAINPAGALIDLDRGAPRNQWFNWSSEAEVATQINDDHWTVEIRIPVTDDANDPLHQVIGHRPTQSLPWFINVCRQRVRNNGIEYSAFSPTGSTSFHKPLKFAHFYSGRSHKFLADTTVNDFMIHSRSAEILQRGRKWKEALNEYFNLSMADEITDYQKSVALQNAAMCALNLKESQKAFEIADLIPIKVISKTTRMKIMTSERKWDQIISEYGEEDLNQWPFWQTGEAAFERAKAYYFTDRGEKADKDLQTALKYTPDERIQVSIRSMMAQNRETNLEDEEGALPIYLKNIAGKERIGSADELRSLIRAADIMVRQGKISDALGLFSVIDFEKLKGSWLHEMLISKGNTLLAANKTTEARKLYSSVLSDKSASKSHRKAAEQGINQLELK